MTTPLSQWSVPPIDALLHNLKRIVDEEDAAARTLRAIRHGAFVDRDGRRDVLHGLYNPPRQIALLCWLAQRCERQLSVEVGFGMGSTASCILSARRTVGNEFEHIVFDRWGVGAGRGEITQNYLTEEFPGCFQRQWRLSSVGLAFLLEEYGESCTDLILVDGDHRFDGVMTDFHIADRLLAKHGFMVLDDAAYPGVESLVNFVLANRHDYEVSCLEIENTAVFRKVSRDIRDWSHFRPFQVSDRHDWDRHPDADGAHVDDWQILE